MLKENIPQSEEKKDSSSLTIYKLIILIIIFVISLSFALLPIKCTFFKHNLKLIGIANAFSAGVFLAIALVHLLPESTEKLNQKFSSQFPISFFICILGYSLILFLEKILFVQEGEIDDHKDDKDDGSDIDLGLDVSTNKSEMEQISFYLHSSFKGVEAEKNEENFKQFFSTTGRISKMITTGKRSEDTLLNHPFNSEDEHFQDSHTPIPSSGNNSYNSSHYQLTSYIVLVAFSIHSIFEGIALGLQDKGTQLLYLFIAISCHKWVESLTIGINFTRTKSLSYEEKIKFIIIFAITTPIGIFIGIIFYNTSTLLEGIFFALSSGTFIYISASEVVIEEFSISKYKRDKFLGFLVGVVMIFALTIIENSTEKVN